MSELALIDRVSAAKPVDDLAAAARAAIRSENWEAAEALAADWFEADPETSEALFVRALACLQRGDLAQAAAFASEAHAMRPEIAEYADLLAVIHGLAGDLNSAVYYGKLATTTTADPRLAALVPTSQPGFATVLQAIEEQPLLRRGAAAMADGRWADAEYWLRQHVAFFQDSREAYLGLASCLLSQGLPYAAVDTLRAARHALPFDADIASMLGKALATTGRFAEAHACHRSAINNAPTDPAVHASALIARLHDPAADPAQTVALFRQWGGRFGMPAEEAQLTFGDGGPVCIGYVLAPNRVAQESAALADVLSRHDSRRYRLIGFGHGAPTDGANIPFQKCFDRWHDISAIDPLTLQMMVRAEGVDILVDVAGFSAPELLTAFGGRMAPCQVAWLGSPCGTGLAAMDFCLTDRFVEAGKGGRRRIERVAHLDLGSSLVSLPSSHPPSPAERSGDAIVFAADAAPMEIHALSVEWWARVLHRAPGSTLILRDYAFQTADSLGRLLDLFGDFGLAHRVEVAEVSSSQEFYAEADIALLPLPFPRPQSAVDALWAGLPVICPTGNGLHTRRAASLLHHLGFARQMVGACEEDYVALAFAWSLDAAGRKDLRATVRARLTDCPVLDPSARAADLEAAYRRMWRKRKHQGDRPAGGGATAA